MLQNTPKFPSKFLVTYAYDYRDNLSRHMKEVHGGEKHKCEKCPAAFSRGTDLEKKYRS